jgi:flagellar M-ring protein FliF
VPGVLAQDVTIVDESGVALTRAAASATDPDGGATSSARLDLKQDTEAYLARKAAAVLDRALGAGAATASVDVTLDMDRVQTHTEEVLGAPGQPGDAPAGLIAKERETTRELGAPVNPAGGGTSGAQGGSDQHEVEYALGRRVAQVVNQPGSIKHLQVAVVVHRSLGAAQLEQLRQTVGAAVGASFERGDAVVVQTTDGFLAPGGAASDAVATASQAPVPEMAAPARATRPSDAGRAMTLGVLAIGVLVALAGALLLRGSRHAAGRTLSEDERQRALDQLRAWMAEGQAARTPESPR